MPSAKELRDIAKEMGIRGYSQMRKAGLEAAIQAHAAPAPGTPAQTQPPATTETGAVRAPAKKERKQSKWVEFLKEHSKTAGISYKAAMLCKEEYASWKDGGKADEKAQEEAQEGDNE